MPKTIFFFHPSSDLYGADKILIYVMRSFSSYKKYLILPCDGPLCKLVNEELPDVEIRIIPELPIIAKKNLKPTGIFSFIYSFLSFPFKLRMDGVKPDVIYVNTLAVTPVLMYYLFSKMKKVVHIHEILKNDSFLHRIINKFALRRSDVLICVSNAVKNNMKLAALKYENKLQLVQNGINFKLNKARESKLEVNSNKINFGLIGRIKPDNKGQGLLLDAISKLDKTTLDKTHFYLVGSPVVGQEYMLADVEKMIKDLDLVDVVTIISFVKDIESIYEKMDVVLVPSIFDDPFPTTVLEGMFFSKPVIGTEVGGIPEMIEDGVTGYVTARGDAAALSDKIKFFAENPDKIKLMGDSGKIRFTQNFSENSFHERFQQMIQTHIF